MCIENTGTIYSFNVTVLNNIYYDKVICSFLQNQRVQKVLTTTIETRALHLKVKMSGLLVESLIQVMYWLVAPILNHLFKPLNINSE